MHRILRILCVAWRPGEHRVEDWPGSGKQADLRRYLANFRSRGTEICQVDWSGGGWGRKERPADAFLMSMLGPVLEIGKLTPLVVLGIR